MKRRFQGRAVVALLALLFAVSVFVGTTVRTTVSADEVQTLDGFTCEGASVNAEEIGMRFVFRLSGDAVQKSDKTAGVVYMPYDLYDGDVDAFVKGQSGALTTTFTWKDNAETTEDETDKIGYTYLSADVIPSTMYNRMLLVRGYIEDDGSVYYTRPIKTSMAYSAWKGIDSLPDYESTLKQYMGPYTITYGAGDADKITDLYYGDPVTGLPTKLDGIGIEKWYWDEELTDEIEAGDYATGSMRVYCKFSDYTVSGTVACADDVDLTTVKIAVDGVDTEATVEQNGAFSFDVMGGTHDFKFYCDGYVAYKTNTKVAGETELTVTLQSDLYDIGDYGSTTSTKGLAFNADGVYTVTGDGYAYIMPNTATAEAYEFSALITDKEKPEDSNSTFGFVISNGTNMLTFAFRNSAIIIGVGPNGGAWGEYIYVASPLSNVWGFVDTWKLVRTADTIELWRKPDGGTDRHLITLTATGVTELDKTNPGWDEQYWHGSDTTHITEDGFEMLAGFFGEGVQHAVGLGALPKEVGTGNATCTYTCSYVEHKKYTVSGTVSGDGADLSAVKIAVDGEETDTAVSASGKFSLQVPGGTHEFKFYCEGYVAYVTREITGNTSDISVTLQDDLFDIGDYGNTKSSKGLAFNAEGIYTISGNGYAYIMPNTATADDFKFTADVSDVTVAATGSIGFVVSNGTNVITIGLRNSFIYVNIGANGAAWGNYIKVNMPIASVTGKAAWKLVRTSNAIELWRKPDNGTDRHMITITQDGVTEWDRLYPQYQGSAYWTIDNDTKMTDDSRAALKGFFGEDVSLAVGLGALPEDLGTTGSTCTYTCSYVEHKKYTVSGTVTCENGTVDLEKVKIAIDGKETDATVTADGAFSVKVLAGEHEFKFYCDGYVGTVTQEITANTSNVSVTLEFKLYEIGDYGNTKSTTGLASNAEGVYTISGNGYAYIMPNTATTDGFEFTAAVSNVTMAATAWYGFVVSNGTYIMTIAIRNSRVLVNIGTIGGATGNYILVTTPVSNVVKDMTWTLTRTSDAIKIGYTGRHMITITKDGVTEWDLNYPQFQGSQYWTIDNDTNMTDDSKTALKGFFGEDVSLAVGLGALPEDLGTTGSTCTYTCSYKKTNG